MPARRAPCAPSLLTGPCRWMSECFKVGAQPDFTSLGGTKQSIFVARKTSYTVGGGVFVLLSFDHMARW